MAISREQYDRLPKYGRDEIDRLRRLAEEYLEELEALRGAAQTHIFYREGLNEHPLPPYVGVRFYVEEEGGRRGHFDVRLYKNQELEVRTESSQLAAISGCSNVMHLRRLER